MRSWEKISSYFIILLIGVLPLFVMGVSNHGLWSADEPRVAEIGREMALTGNWAVPMLNQKPFLEEPPLYYATLAVTFRTLGVSDKVARIPSAFFALATVLVLFFVVNSIFGPRVALLSGFILATTGEYFRVAHWIVVDSALTFFVVSSMALFITGYLTASNRKKFLYYALLYIAATLAFYTKGFIGIVIPGLGILAFLAFERNLREILKMRLWLGILIFLAMTLPWFVALWQQAGWEHLNVFFVHNHLQRFFPAGMAGRISGAASGHHHPLYYYITEFPNGFLPWSVLVIPVFYHAFSKKRWAYAAGTVQDKGRLFALCWFFTGIIFLSVASTKRALYLMPIFAPVSLLTALFIDATIISGLVNRIEKIFLWTFVLLLLAIGLALPPTFFYARAAYPLASSWSLLVPTLAVSVLVTGIALVGVFFLYRRNFARYWVSISLPIFIVLVFTLLVLVPVLDRHKSFVPFCNHVTALISADKPLYGYKADETLRGAVPFYTGHFFTEINESAALPSSGDEPYYVLIRDSKETTEGELSSLGKVHPVVKQFMGSGRTLTLFSSQPAGKTVVIVSAFAKMKKHRGSRMNRL